MDVEVTRTEAAQAVTVMAEAAVLADSKSGEENTAADVLTATQRVAAKLDSGGILHVRLTAMRRCV